MNKCVFLDRDGVLNVERGTYSFTLEDFEIIPGVDKALQRLKKSGFYLVVVTNQAGISKGLFSAEQMENCHQHLLEKTNHLIDDIYYAPLHTDISNSLMRKPDTLMFEKAIAKYQIETSGSWMIGNAERDMIPALKLGMKTIFIGEELTGFQITYYAKDLRDAAEYILSFKG